MANNPLQSSGQISFADINIELGRSSTATIGIDNAENGDYGCIQQCAGTSRPQAGNPAAITEWYNYNHTLRAVQDTATQYDGPYSTIAEACASTVIQGTNLWVYSPSGGYYKNTDGKADCCVTCADNGYYWRISAGNYLSVTSCAGTISSCPPPPPPPPPPVCTCDNGACTAACSNAFAFCSDPVDCY